MVTTKCWSTQTSFKKDTTKDVSSRSQMKNINNDHYGKLIVYSYAFGARLNSFSLLIAHQNRIIYEYDNHVFKRVVFHPDILYCIKTSKYILQRVFEK